MKTIYSAVVAGLGLFGAINVAHAGSYDSGSYGILPGGCYSRSNCETGRCPTDRYPTASLPIGCDFSRDPGYVGRYDDRYTAKYGHSSWRPDFESNSAWKNDWLRSTTAGPDRFRSTSSYGSDDCGYAGSSRSTRMFEPWPGRSSASRQIHPVSRW